MSSGRLKALATTRALLAANNAYGAVSENLPDDATMTDKANQATMANLKVSEQ